MNENTSKRLKQEEEYSIKAKKEFVDKMENFSQISPNYFIYNYKTLEKPIYKKGYLKSR